MSAAVTGLMGRAAYDECPNAQITSMAMEFGTKPLKQVLPAMRAMQQAVNGLSST